MITTAGGPLPPVRLEQAVEAARRCRRRPRSSGSARPGPSRSSSLVAPAARRARPRLAGARSRSTGSGRLAEHHDVVAVFELPRLPVDRRHNSKIDRTRLAAWAARSLRGQRLDQAVKVLVTGATSLIGRAPSAGSVDRGDDVTTLQRGRTGLAAREVRGSITDPDAVAAGLRRPGRGRAPGRPGPGHRRLGRLRADQRRRHRGARRGRAPGRCRVVRPRVVAVGRARRPVAGGRRSRRRRIRQTARGAYARSKAIGEILALDASTAAMPVVAIRPHLIWGPGDTQLVGRVVDRARRGRLALVGSGTALVDTIYLDNAADALVAAVDRAPQLGGRAFVISNGEPRTATELMARVLTAAGLTVTPRHVPTWLAKAGGSLVEQIWARTGRTDDPPMTRFLAEQLATAHWFRQAESRAALHWTPAVSLAVGFARLADWYRTAPAAPNRPASIGPAAQAPTVES